MPLTITVRMDEKCPECGKKGVANHGLCLRCNARAMVPERVMKSEVGRLMQERWKRIRFHRTAAVDAAQPARVGGAEA